jgi:hypothetical protein
MLIFFGILLWGEADGGGPPPAPATPARMTITSAPTNAMAVTTAPVSPMTVTRSV